MMSSELYKLQLIKKKNNEKLYLANSTNCSSFKRNSETRCLANSTNCNSCKRNNQAPYLATFLKIVVHLTVKLNEQIS